VSARDPLGPTRSVTATAAEIHSDRLVSTNPTAAVFRMEVVESWAGSRAEGPRRFSNHLEGIFVVSQSNKPGMPPLVGTGPLQELDLCHNFRGAAKQIPSFCLQ
jgi:hypothetical protein